MSNWIANRFELRTKLNFEPNWTANRTESIILAITLEEKGGIHLRLVLNWSANRTELRIELSCESNQIYHSHNNTNRKRWHSFKTRVELNCELNWTELNWTEVRIEVNCEPNWTSNRISYFTEPNLISLPNRISYFQTNWTANRSELRTETHICMTTTTRHSYT